MRAHGSWWLLLFAVSCFPSDRFSLAQDDEAGVDWPSFLGPTADSKSPEKGILTDWSDGKLKIVWQKEIGISYGIGSISNGKLYQFDRHEDAARLTCMDARTGKELWRYEYPTDYVDPYAYNGGPRCSPVVDGDRIYLYGVEGMLTCVTTSGKLVWMVDTMASFGVVKNFFGVGSTPVVEGDLLIVMVGGSPADQRGTSTSGLDRVTGNGSGIVAFDKMTGKVKYQITDELASYASLKLATIDGRRWCFAFCRGGLIGFEPASGKVDFQYPWRAKILESVNASMPVVVDDEVFISETYGPGSSMLKVSPGSHTIVWADPKRSREKAMQTHWNTPIHHKGFLYGSSGRHSYNAELRCIEWGTGKVRWSISRLSRSSLLLVDEHLVCLTEYGELFLFKPNPDKFEVVTQAKLKGADGTELLSYPCWAAPIVSHGLMYVRGKDRLICLRLVP